jgi:hypothetical protein
MFLGGGPVRPPLKNATSRSPPSPAPSRCLKASSGTISSIASGRASSSLSLANGCIRSSSNVSRARCARSVANAIKKGKRGSLKLALSHSVASGQIATSPKASMSTSHSIAVMRPTCTVTTLLFLSVCIVSTIHVDGAAKQSARPRNRRKCPCSLHPSSARALPPPVKPGRRQ